MSKEWFLECLADPWVFNSVAEFQKGVEGGGLLPCDGSGELLFVNKETLQLERGDTCFRDGVDFWKVAEGESKYGLEDKTIGVAEKTIERIINHFSDDKRQLIGVLWYNK